MVTHLNPKNFHLEVVNFLQPAGCSYVMWLCCYTYVNCDLKVILLLANESLISGGVVEAFISIDVVGKRRPTTQNKWFVHVQFGGKIHRAGTTERDVSTTTDD